MRLRGLVSRRRQAGRAYRAPGFVACPARAPCVSHGDDDERDGGRAEHRSGGTKEQDR